MEKQVTTHRGGHLEALLNGCPDAIIAINAEGIIKFANKEACKLTERNMNELIGESIVDVYETLELAKEANRKLYEGGGTIHDHESRVRTKSGKVIPVRISASHLKDSAGKYIGGVGYFAQYRPWTGAEAEVKSRLDELESRLDTWKTLAAPVFELYPRLSVMVIVGHLDAGRFEDIITNLLNHVEKVKTRVILLDLSAAVVDEVEVANQLAKTIRTVRLLGADCIIADMHSTLARAMEPLMADLGSVKSFSCMDIALEEALKTIGYEIRKKD
ncbi:MAG: PAS domain-containing protein [Dehalococcoidales bacterium]|nr:MAG: PAS domain-containing protein [Dehalococcoidales bacterium]